jgi:4-carboxymuconolactone decarboxylase
MKNFRSLTSLDKKYLLPLLCSASVLRLNSHFNLLIKQAKKNRISHNKIYEALLQNYLFAGYPSALVSLKMLREHYPKVRIRNSDDMNLYHYRKRGENNCKTIYGDKYEKLINNIRKFSPELSSWLILEGYGKVFGRKRLSLKERELCSVSVLVALMFEDQLYSHINGALRIGASLDEVQNVIDNLSLLGNKASTNFGNRVLIRYLKEKGML